MTNRYALCALVACVTAIAACDKNGVQAITAPAPGAAVKFFNFGVGAPGVNFFAGAEKVTAISSTSCQPPNDTTATCKATGVESTTGTGYGAAAAGALYSQVTPGSVTLTANISANADKNLAISSVTANVEAGKFYSYFVSGIYNTTSKKADAFIVEDQIPTAQDPVTAYVRFVNAESNGPAMVLYGKNEDSGAEVAIGAAVAYKSAGAFTAIPAGVYDLNTRASGSSANIISRTAVSFVAGHVYTVTARGDATSTATATKPALDNTANR